MSATPEQPQTERKKTNKPLVFILIGCGGCLLLSGLTLVIGTVWLGATAKKGIESVSNTTLIDMQLATQRMLLSIHLGADTATADRIDEVYTELDEMAKAGELTQQDVTKLDKEIETASKDNKITTDEGKKILDLAEDITGG